MNLNRINIKQLIVLHFLSRLRRSKFVRDGLIVKQAAGYADNFSRNFYNKKLHTRISSKVLCINNLIAENIETPNYKPIKLKKNN